MITPCSGCGALIETGGDDPFPYRIGQSDVVVSPCPPALGIPCKSCSPATDCTSDPVFPYSLTQGPILPFVGDCPPGFDCGSATSVSFNCCGNILTAPRPANATRQQISDLFGAIVAQCVQYQSICGLSFNMVPTIFYLNPAVSSPAVCPDGSQNTFTQPAGTWSGLTQADAQNQALNVANQQATLRQVCLGPLQNGAANGGVFYSQTLVASGQGIQNATSNPWSIVSGALPSGMSFGPSVFPYSSITISGTPVALGTFNFTVQFQSPTGAVKQKNYSIVVSSIIPTLSLTPEYNAILASWNSVVGATSYQLFRRVHNVGSFVLVGTTSGLSFNDTTALSGTSYDYNLAALAGAVVLGTSANQTASPLVTPAIALIPIVGGISCSWSAVPGANSYQVSRAVHNSGSFSVINTTSGLSFTDNTPNGSTQYDYTFTAFNGASPIVTSLISVATPTLPAAPNLNATPGNGEVFLSWTAVAGATGYRLHSGTTNGGPYPFFGGLTTALSITDSPLPNGTTFYYVVQAVANNCTGPLSVQQAATPTNPAVPLNFNNLVWLNPPTTVAASPPGFATISYSNGSNSTQANAVTVWNGGSPASHSQYTNSASLTYTGDAVACVMNFNITSMQYNAGVSIRMSVSVNGVTVISKDNIIDSLGVGNHAFPFTVPASTGAVIRFNVSVTCDSTGGETPNSANVTGLLTPAF